MNATRILGALCASILASSLGFGTVACGTPTESPEAATAKVVSAASVSIQMYDQNGTRVGEGTGILLAPRLVLTSGHLIAGNYKWVVTGADGKSKVTGSRGMTYDWQKYDSKKAHPRRHDVGVIHLDDAIRLDAYPKLVTEKSADGASAMRIHGNGSTFETADASLVRYKSSPNAWLSEMRGGETLDTGGAVFDGRGIVGVVSGRGLTTGKLYIAKVDVLTKWLAPKVACAGGSAGIRTYAEGQTKDTICDDEAKKVAAGGGTGGTGGTGATSGDSTNGADINLGGSCDTNFDGLCSGGLCGLINLAKPGDEGVGIPGSTGPTGTSGMNGATNPAQSPSAGGGAGGIFGGSNYDGYTSKVGFPVANGGWNANSIPGDGSNTGGAGTNGTNGSTSTSGTNGAKPGSGTTNTGGSGSSDTNPNYGGTAGSNEGEACQGASDNPDLCPPEPDGCAGSACGGGSPDDTIDYGGMGAAPSSDGTGGVTVK